ncbi:YdiK family protein [Neobacillus sp. YIM B06451]|uniref:YdiK family protein n=1 Tax=Neobacillus sp. YIM B06451 TaxID=3070994 RepID=UPI00293064B3|nr:YdiK family protein [Neobacillus sp. YIM B06451]
MRQSPLFSGIVYLLLGILFTYFAVGSVRDEGWGFFSYLLVILATFDFGAGIRMISLHYKLKRIQKK